MPPCHHVPMSSATSSPPRFRRKGGLAYNLRVGIPHCAGYLSLWARHKATSHTMTSAHRQLKTVFRRRADPHCPCWDLDAWRMLRHKSGART
eukprot:352476-Chlamydomonas_euryale.AAC.28